MPATPQEMMLDALWLLCALVAFRLLCHRRCIAKAGYEELVDVEQRGPVVPPPRWRSWWMGRISTDRARDEAINGAASHAEPLRNRYPSSALKLVLGKPLNLPRLPSLLPPTPGSTGRRTFSAGWRRIHSKTPSRVNLILNPQNPSESLANMREKLRRVGRETPRVASARALLTPSSRSRSAALEEVRRTLRSSPPAARLSARPSAREEDEHRSGGYIERIFRARELRA